MRHLGYGLAVMSLLLTGCVTSQGPVGPSRMVGDDAHQLISPNGKHAVILQISPKGGMELLFRRAPGEPFEFVKDWGSGISAIWSPNGRRVLVTARENTTDQLCEVFAVSRHGLAHLSTIHGQLPLSVEGGYRGHVSGLGWSADSRRVFVKQAVWGDGGYAEGLFLVEAKTGKLIRRLSEMEAPR